MVRERGAGEGQRVRMRELSSGGDSGVNLSEGEMIENDIPDSCKLER